MGFIMKYWRWFAGGGIAALLIGALLGYGEYQYRAGKRAGELKVQTEVAEAVKQQTQATLEKERQAQAQLAQAQAQIEQERENAKTTITALRTERDRLREYADTRRRAVSQTATAAGASDGAEAARGWQLFSHCSERLSGLAEVTDGYRNDLAEWQAYGKVMQEQARD